MNEQNKGTENQATARTSERHDFAVKRSLRSDIICGILAVVTTLLIWLGGAF